MLIDVNGATYAYTVQGEGEPLILLHGFTGSQQTWETFVRQWCDSFQVITIDLPGHGRTVTATPRTIEMVVDDLHMILQHLNINKAHFIGYSMGGRVALAYALTYQETILSLILESSSPGLTSHKERAQRRKSDQQLINRLSSDGLNSFIDFWENIPLFATQKQLPEDIQIVVREERKTQSPDGLIESLRYMGTGQQPSLWNDLQSLHCHVLLIVGEQDKKFVHLNKEMAKLLPHVTVKIIEQAGHTIHLEQPKQFYNEVTSFIQAN